MDLIKEAIHPQDKVPYVKAHSIANKCMANIVGEEKAISKDELKDKYPDMIPLRDEVLSSTTELMALNEKFNLGLSISETIYKKYGTKACIAWKIRKAKPVGWDKGFAKGVKEKSEIVSRSYKLLP